jgi:hypothetical protein
MAEPTSSQGGTMRLARRICLVLALGATLAVPAALAASGKSAAHSKWTRITGPGNAGAQLGLARTSDGVLNVIWNHGNPAPTSIYDTRYSLSGGKLTTSTVATKFGGAGGLGLLVMPDGSLRLFASGAPTTNSAAVGINTFTAPANGTGWHLVSGDIWGGPPAGASSTIGATLTKTGEPVTGWGGAFQVGLAAGGSGTTACACFSLQGNLATDAGTGAVVMSGLGQPSGYKYAGTFVQEVTPASGGRVMLPSANQGSGDSGISGRSGASGVYVMYSDYTRPNVTKPAVRLYRYKGATRTIAKGQFTVAKAFAGPEGRLWLAWGDAHTVFVTRTNKAAGRREPVQKLKAPPGTGFLADADGEGSQGALDLFVKSDAGGNYGFFHAHVLARFALGAKVARHRKGRPAKVTLIVRDAGDPVAGVKIKIGRRPLTTNAKGAVTLTLKSGSYSVKATASGYKAASAKVRVS